MTLRCAETGKPIPTGALYAMRRQGSDTYVPVSEEALSRVPQSERRSGDTEEGGIEIRAALADVDGAGTHTPELFTPTQSLFSIPKEAALKHFPNYCKSR